MNFNVKINSTIKKELSTGVEEMIFSNTESIVCTEENINTYVVPQQAADEFVTVNLNAFGIANNQTTKFLQVVTDKSIFLKMNVAGTAGAEPTDQEVIDFPGVLISSYVEIDGNIENLYFSRLVGETGSATVKIRIFG